MIAVATSAPVAAHTDLESTQPSDGDIVSHRVSQITLTFTRLVEPAPGGLTAFDEQGLEHKPDSLSSADGQTWHMHFETPLANGNFEVYRRMAAADDHIIEGTFAFTIALVEPQPSTAPSPDSHDAQATESLKPVESTTPQEGEPQSTQSASTTPSVYITAPETPLPSSAAAPTEPYAEGHSASLPTPHRNSATSGPKRIAETARILILLATLGIVGGLAFLWFIVRGEPLDSDRVRRWVSASGIVLAASAIVASLNRAVVLERDWTAFWSPDAINDALSTHFGVAAGLRLLGGIAVFVAVRRGAQSPIRIPTALIAFIGGALVVASYAFDGHTVTEGPRWLHATASVTHVSTTAIWGGGVALLADLLWRRHRRGADVVRPLMRFSRMAAAALVLAGAAGTTMAILVLDSFGDLWSTPWGRLLLAKIALVAVAAGIGAHNRWVLIPAVDRQGQATIHQRLRRAVFIEAVALGCVAVITAFLVAASAV